MTCNNKALSATDSSKGLQSQGEDCWIAQHKLIYVLLREYIIYGKKPTY